MIRFKLIAFLFFVLYTINKNAYGQNSLSDTIFVNTEAEIALKFPYDIQKILTNPRSTAYSMAVEGKRLVIKTNEENTNPTHLFIDAGTYSLEFIIAYKNEISKYYFHYTKKDVEQLVKEQEERKLKGDIPKVIPVIEKPKTDNFDFLMQEGDKNMTLGRYDEAELNFEDAGKVRPESTLPAQKRDEIKRKRTEQQRIKDLEKNRKYNALTTDAKVFFDLKRFEESKAKYIEALGEKPGDFYVTTQIEKIQKILNTEKVLAEQRKNNKLFNDYMAEGKKALEKNQLPEARTAIELATGIKPNDPAATAILKILIDKEENENKKLLTENNYREIIEAADKLYQQKDYNNAKDEYNKALVLFKRPWPLEQIKNINKKMSELAISEVLEKQRLEKQAEIDKKERERLELEDNYKAAIEKADKFFQEKDYKNAKAEYIKARDYIKRPWPEEQINNINTLISHQIAAENLERQKRLAEEKNNTQYNSVIDKADAEFEKSNYAKARLLYNEAYRLKPAEQYPQERLAMIADIEKKRKEKQENLAKAAEEKKKYQKAIEKGRSYLIKDDLSNAKIAFEEAIDILPSEEEAQKELNKVNTKIEENRLNADYDEKISIADRFLAAQEYESAIKAYQTASSIKPAETYPGKQIRHCQGELDIAARLKAYNDSIRKVIEWRRKLSTAMENGDKANKDARFADAIAAYNEVLTIQSNNEGAKRGLQIATYQLEKERQKNAPIKVEEPDDKKKKRKKKQKN